MSLEVINEESLTIGELREKLLELKKREKELPTRIAKTLEYTQHQTKIENVKKLKAALEKAEVNRLKSRHITKIIDLAPQNIDQLRILFTGENLTIKQEDLNKILAIIQET